MKGSEIFCDELSCIHNNALRLATADFLDNVVPQYFYEIPASSTGKYHPWYSLGYGGLVRHTKAAVKIAVDLLCLEQYQDLPYDEIISALILHDTFKRGFIGSGHTAFLHPEIARTKLLYHNQEVFSEVAELVYTHMGQWNISHKRENLPKPQNEAQKFVHLCDYLASRKYITIEVQ